MFNRASIARTYASGESIVVHHGDCMDLLRSVPGGAIQLVVTSPPYNLGKEYEERLDLDDYVQQQEAVIRECLRALSPEGSLCWQVGNYVDKGRVIPLDALLYPVFAGLGLTLKNRIVWHFEHGLHCSRRFSGRYETINWFVRSSNYYFDVDPVRVPQKYPGKKHFKGPKAGHYSCNPKGKNPGDVWSIPNVKSNHVEKTDHPCQFPVELVERLVLSMSRPGDRVLDPFMGTGSTLIAAIRHGRKGLGAETQKKYVAIALERISKELDGVLKTRPMHKPVYDPGRSKLSRPPAAAGSLSQMDLLEDSSR